MDIIGTKISLVIGEPWDLSKTIVGPILQQFTYGDFTDNHKETYFMIEDSQSSERFIISTRYVGQKIADIYKGKMIMVAIVLPENDFSFPDSYSEFLAKVTYFGIGGITLVRI